MADEHGKAPTSTRTMWKGAISFGLVHIPVGLYSATASTGIDFDWLDKRSMQPVGYKRVNKVTGKEIAAADIVKGVEYEDGRYVVLSPEEIAAAYPKVTQTIEIEAFLDADEIPFVYLERPYYTAPLKRVRRSTRCCARRCARATRSVLPRSSFKPNSTWPSLSLAVGHSYSTFCDGGARSGLSRR